MLTSAADGPMQVAMPLPLETRTLYVPEYDFCLLLARHEHGWEIVASEALPPAHARRTRPPPGSRSTVAYTETDPRPHSTLRRIHRVQRIERPA
jgi:hypothetical protein